MYVETAPDTTSEATEPASQPTAPVVTTRARRYQSWGRFPKSNHHAVKSVFWQQDADNLAGIEGSVLPFGYGRTYGDSCLNDGGTLIDITGLRKFISFDEANGVVRCEAGVMLADILEVCVPRGWFLPVTPGTKFVSIGGAIANDVHGKNHHVAGTFGRHLTQFELLRSSGERLICSPTQNVDLFKATIGGLGLTGLIVWAEFKLRKIPGPYIAYEQIRFNSIDEFFELTQEFDQRFEYTVSWVDCLAVGKNLGRGYFMLGNHDKLIAPAGHEPKAKTLVPATIDAPGFLLNKYTVKAFNTFWSLIHPASRKVESWDPFFYPLDFVNDWNKLYGPAGFLQYQLVVPFDGTNGRLAIKTVLEKVAQAGEASFLVVCKTFGDIQSPGMLSFPRRGVTLSLDFPYRGEKTLRLLERLDAIVRDSGGAIYPAKDARMSPETFKQSFPRWQEFSQYIDPKFSSNFWRRVTGEV